MRRLVKEGFILFHGQRGLSLIETLVAAAVLGIIGVAFMSAMTTNSRASGVLNEQVVATNLATAYLEAIKVLPYSDNYTNAGDNITLPFQYNVALTKQYSADGTTWVNSYSTQTLQKVTILVSREGGKPVLSICTYRTNR